MHERPYFDHSGELSDLPGQFVHINDLDQLTVGASWRRREEGGRHAEAMSPA
jgi:hypothetical protein